MRAVAVLVWSSLVLTLMHSAYGSVFSTNSVELDSLGALPEGSGPGDARSMEQAKAALTKEGSAHSDAPEAVPLIYSLYSVQTM